MCEEAGVVCAQGRGSGANVAQELAAPGQGPPAGPCAAGELPAQAVPGPPQIANAADRPVSAAASRQCPGDCLVTRPPSQGVQHPVAAPRDAASAEERSSRGGDRHNPDGCRLSESRKSYRPRNHGKQTLGEPGADGNAPESDHGTAFPRPSLARHPASVPPRGDRGRQRLLPPLFTPTPVVLEGGNVRLEFDNVITNNTAAVPGGQSSASPLLPEQFRFSALPRRHDGAGKKEATQAFSAHKAPLDPSIAVVPEHRFGQRPHSPSPRHHSVVDDVLSPFRKLFAPVLSSAGSPVTSRPGSAASGKQSPAGFSSSEEEEAHAAPRGASRGFTETRLRAKYGKLGRVVGRGSGGTVRLIRRNMDNKLFAVKELRQRAADEDRREYTKRLTNEFCIGSTLHHENICETLEIFEDDSKFYEIMEYCPTDLFALVQSGSMVRADIDCLFSQILRGVAYLHSVGIAHRDLKLDNCVVSFFGPQDCRACLKIIDFGCSTVFRVPWETMAHECTGVYGSDPYIPPEEFMCARYDARCADVWAAAVIYVCMSARQFPWRVARPDVDRRFQGYYTLRSSSCIDALAEAQRDVVYRMLEICPSERATAEEVLADPWVSQIETCCQGADRAGDPVLKHAHRHAPIAGILD